MRSEEKDMKKFCRSRQRKRC